MNDWLDYKGSGSCRAYSGDYVGNTISHYSKKTAERMNNDAEARLYSAYIDKMDKLKQEYSSMENKLQLLRQRLELSELGRHQLESQRSVYAVEYGALKAQQKYSKDLHKYDKEIAEHKNQISEINSKMSKNLEEQKKTQANMNSLYINTSAGNKWAINNTIGVEKWWGSGDPTEISKPKTNSRNTRRR